MPHTVLDDWRIVPRIMMLAITIMCFQVTSWAMSLEQMSIEQSGFCSVIFGCFSACFAVWLGKESKTTVTSDKVVYEEKYDKR